MCLREGEQGTCFGHPFSGGPLEVFRSQIFLILVKNLLSAHTIFYAAHYNYVLYLQRGPKRNCIV